MKKSCAWCHVIIESPAGRASIESHGICLRCFSLLLPTLGDGDDQGFDPADGPSRRPASTRASRPLAAPCYSGGDA